MAMNRWLKLSDEERLISIQQASAKSGLLSTKAIEKDWWVTLVLKALFQSDLAPHLSFKGGTSLSKGWQLTDRFSEDIDIAIDRKFLGFDQNLSKHKVKQLKKAACEFTSTILKTRLEEEFDRLGIPVGVITVTADPVRADLPDTDPQVLRIEYRSLLDPVPYIADSVKLEVSARALNEPAVSMNIHSFLGIYMPGFKCSGEPFPVALVEPKRTFLEKIFLLHEEFLRPADKINHQRMSRHLYDLDRLMDTIHAEKALNLGYYESIVEHRRRFIFKSGVNYDSHHPSTINFLPPETVMANFEKDYALMREQMIHDPHSKDLSVILERLNGLLKTIRQLTHLL